MHRMVSDEKYPFAKAIEELGGIEVFIEKVKKKKKNH